MTKITLEKEEKVIGEKILFLLGRYRDVVNKMDRDQIVKGSFDYYYINLNKAIITRKTHPIQEGVL